MTGRKQQECHYTDKFTRTNHALEFDFNLCPLCKGDLEVDEEYMQSMYGEAFWYVAGKKV